VKPKPSQGKESLPDFTQRTTAAATTIGTKNGTTSTNCSNDFWMSCVEAHRKKEANMPPAKLTFDIMLGQMNFYA